MGTRLWQTKQHTGNAVIDAFTVGDDYLLDEQLLPFDLRASSAHADMLMKMGVLTAEENKTLQKGLEKILDQWKKNAFPLRPENEDGHTAIEIFLTEYCGEVGKKIHTGRSRNDQALVMMRLFLQEKNETLLKKMNTLVATFHHQSKALSKIMMPGYTHMQRAMPTTVAVWLSAFEEGLREQLPFFEATKKILDQNPLGSASGFGVRNFPLKRSVTTTKLGFRKTQENPIYCGLSRGLFEYNICSMISPSLLLLSRFFADLLFFTADGRGFFDLPDFLTTGSSIMPQKRNFDCGEIFRGKVAQFLACKNEIEMIQNGLLSGYNRDISLTKGSTIRAINLAEELFEVANIVVENISPNRKNLKRAMSEDIFVTEKVYERVKKGEAFREAYGKVKQNFFDQNKS